MCGHTGSYIPVDSGCSALPDTTRERSCRIFEACWHHQHNVKHCDLHTLKPTFQQTINCVYTPRNFKTDDKLLFVNGAGQLCATKEFESHFARAGDFCSQGSQERVGTIWKDVKAKIRDAIRTRARGARGDT